MKNYVNPYVELLLFKEEIVRTSGVINEDSETTNDDVASDIWEKIP